MDRRISINTDTGEKTNGFNPKYNADGHVITNSSENVEKIQHIEKQEEDYTKLNLYQKINKIMDDIKYLNKDDTVGTGNYSYKAITEEKVTTSIREKLVTYGLVIIPIKQKRDVQQHGLTNKGAINILVFLDVEYKIVNSHNPDDYIIATSSGSGVDTQDKAVGKAMTYAYKYLLLRTFAIPTGNDPDKIASSEIDKQMQIDNEEQDKQMQIKREELKKLIGDDEDLKQKILVAYQVEKIDLLNLKSLNQTLKRLNKKKPLANKTQIDELEKITGEKLRKEIYDAYKIKDFKELTYQIAEQLLERIHGRIAERKQIEEGSSATAIANSECGDRE